MTVRRRLLTAGTLVVSVATLGAVATAPSALAAAPDVHISELHYDNDGADTGEFVEVSGPAGTTLTGWSIVLYNGNGGPSYGTIALSGTLDDEGAGAGALAFDAVGLQNGAPDGLALVDSDGTVVEFLSYEGSFAAIGGPADGLTSSDIGVSESSSSSATDSLQLLAAGWSGPWPTPEVR